MHNNKIKIALIGNMNNNHFTLMRYFRDLGYDAYLFPFQDELDHFQPECDTFEIEKWKPYISILPFKNGNIKNFLFLSRKEVKKEIDGFDYYIGSGFSPAYFYKAGIKLDIFIPYSVYIEFISLKKTRENKFFKKITNSVYYYFQKKGLQKNTRTVATAEKTAIESCIELDLHFKNLAVPCVYNGESYEHLSVNLSQELLRIKKSELVVFSHVSHIYLNVDPIRDIKKNYILLEGFSQYIKKKKYHTPLLVLTEYGKDIENSKKIIADYGIEEFVLWLPKMNRREIFAILRCANFGGGEYGGLIWGGTGWEFLANGVPFFQFVSLNQEEFQKSTNSPMPSFINTNSPSMIAETLLEFEDNPQKFKEKGIKLKEWFDKYNGIKLAEQYIDLLKINK